MAALAGRVALLSTAGCLFAAVTPPPVVAAGLRVEDAVVGRFVVVVVRAVVVEGMERFTAGEAPALTWTYESHNSFTFGLRTYSSPWALRGLTVSGEPGRKTLWLIATDYIWAKSFITRLDADGHPTVQFVHSGELAVLARIHSPIGPLLWAGGFNDEYDTASLAVLQTTSPLPSLRRLREPLPLCQLRQRRPACLLRVTSRRPKPCPSKPHNKVDRIYPNGLRVEVHQAEISHDSKIIYDFSPDGVPYPLGVYYSANFWSAHQDLERQHRISHPLAECPDRLHPPPVRVYRNGRWSDVSLPPVSLH